MTETENDLIRTLSIQPGAAHVQCEPFDLEFLQRGGDARDRDGMGKITLFIPAFPEHLSEGCFIGFNLEQSDDGEQFFPVQNAEELFGQSGGTTEQEIDLVIPKGVSRFVRPVINNGGRVGIRGEVKVILQLRDPAFKGLVSAANKLIEMHRQYIAETETLKGEANLCRQYGVLRDRLDDAKRALEHLNQQFDLAGKPNYEQVAYVLSLNPSGLASILSELAGKEALVKHREKIIEAYTAHTVAADAKALTDFVKENSAVLKKHRVI